MIVDRIGNCMYCVRVLESGTIWRRHANQIVKSFRKNYSAIPVVPDSNSTLKINSDGVSESTHNSSETFIRRSERIKQVPDRLQYRDF